VNDRQRALRLLRRIERESLYASVVLQNESGFVRTLVLGVLRWRSRLDFVISSLASRRIEPEIVDVLRLGMYQLLYMDVAQHAAVSESVELAPRRARGFVNAILRRAAAGQMPQPDDLATRAAHPPWLIDRWIRTYGADRAAAIADANQQLSFPDVLSLTGDAPPEAVASQLVPGIWKLHGSSAALDRAAFWPMDEGSAAVAAITASAGGEVLDLAAAPGGKSIFIAHRGERVVSNDVSITRLLPLVARGQSSVTVSDGRRPPFARQFRTVLLDAPCSATGTIRKNPEIKWRLKESDLAAFADLQADLLASALQLAAENCVYSTCSLEREENDEVVSSVLASNGHFEIADISPFAPAGVAPWIDDGILRLTPDSGADGFTAFVLRRTP
jgi:16S rRNA (cytosine967-C5)-methyltransferase